MGLPVLVRGVLGLAGYFILLIKRGTIITFNQLFEMNWWTMQTFTDMLNTTTKLAGIYVYASKDSPSDAAAYTFKVHQVHISHLLQETVSTDCINYTRVAEK